MDIESEGELPCGKCGQHHLTPYGTPSCPAHIATGDRKGEPCKNLPGFKTNHQGFGPCIKHGGNTPGTQKAAQKLMVDAEVRQQLGLTSWQPIQDPFSALADHAGKGVAIEEILFQKVEELASLRQYGGELGDRIDVVYEAWERAYSRIGSTLVAMSRLNLEDKIANLQGKVNENTAQAVSTALASALAKVTLTPEQRNVVLAEFGQRLRSPQPALAARP